MCPLAELFVSAEAWPEPSSTALLTLNLITSDSRTKLYNGKCVGRCPAATFADSKNGCSACPANTLTCTATKVLTCQSGFYPLGNACTVESKPFYRLPGVASSSARPGFYQASTTEAKTERQCLEFCTTQGGKLVG